MKKSIFIAVIAFGSLATSCTTDAYELPESKNTSISEENTMQNEFDSFSKEDSGGQTGNNPIKP